MMKTSLRALALAALTLSATGCEKKDDAAAALAKAVPAAGSATAPAPAPAPAPATAPATAPAPAPAPAPTPAALTLSAASTDVEIKAAAGQVVAWLSGVFAPLATADGDCAKAATVYDTYVTDTAAFTTTLKGWLSDKPTKKRLEAELEPMMPALGGQLEKMNALAKSCGGDPVFKAALDKFGKAMAGK